METKFTKGEWKTDKTDVYSSNDNVEGNIICEAPLGFEESMEYWESNAQLISAAPDMFNALFDLYNDRETWSDLFESQQEFICRVLNKATGSDFFKH